MKIKNLINIFEKENENKKIIDYIINKYDDEEMITKYEQTIKKKVPSNWRDVPIKGDKVADDEIQWYSYHSKGEAENEVAEEIIKEAARKNKISLSSSELMDLLTWFFNVYKIFGN